MKKTWPNGLCDNCGNNHSSNFRTAGNPLGKKEWCCFFHELDMEKRLKEQEKALISGILDKYAPVFKKLAKT